MGSSYSSSSFFLMLNAVSMHANWESTSSSVYSLWIFFRMRLLEFFIAILLDFWSISLILNCFENVDDLWLGKFKFCFQWVDESLLLDSKSNNFCYHLFVCIFLSTLGVCLIVILFIAIFFRSLGSKRK